MYLTIKMSKNNMKNISTLKKDYQNKVVSALVSEFKLKNTLSAPKVIKVVVNSGVGEIAKSKDVLEKVINDLSMITGQKPSVRKARVSVAAFSVRKGSVVGLKVTLRDNKMYEFLTRLFKIVLPRHRDFRGLPLKGFDKFGNYTLGFSDQGVFPEIDMSVGSKPFGFEITIVTSTNNPVVSKRLLELMGAPFEK